MADTQKLNEESLQMHAANHGKLETRCKVPLENGHDLAIAYTPGVAAPCLKIKDDPKLSFEYTWRGNVVAVITDGTRVLGMGDIGAEAAMPVMEGKSVLYKKFGDIDSVPICIDTKDPDEFISIVEKLQPSFGGVNLEDISSPKCYQIEAELIKRCQIPIFHDDQHGTAIIACAAVLGALRFVKKDISSARCVVNGCGAAVAGTGRSDTPNQVNNVCVFPGVFRGALDVRSSAITEEMKVAAVHAIAGLIKDEELREDYVVAGAFDRRIVPEVAAAVAKVAMEQGIARIKRDPEDIKKEAAARIAKNWNA